MKDSGDEVVYFLVHGGTIMSVMEAFAETRQEYYKWYAENGHGYMAEWDGMFRQTYHIYGHIHNALNDTYYIMKNRDLAFNAGCMINNYVPVTLNELIQNNQIFKQNN